MTVYKTIYKPGIRGWWEYLRLSDILFDGDGIQWRSLWRRIKPSARLVQAEQERAYWQHLYMEEDWESGE